MIAAATTLRRMTSEAPSSRPPAPPPSPDRGEPAGADLHTTAGKIADLQHRRDEAIHAGSQRAVERQHAKRKMTARERI